MAKKTSFIIPLSGLLEGEHHYSFRMEDDFLKSFDQSPVESGAFDVNVLLLKKISHLELTFTIIGVEHTNCDRCLAKIDLPVELEEYLIVKYGDDKVDEENVVYLPYNETSLDLSKYVYEFVCLHVPMVKLYECEEDENANCNFEILDKLDSSYDRFEEEEEQGKKGSLAESLKNIKL